jgi:hypothetical protein
MEQHRELVTSITFGERVAELEADELSSYFVKTETWRQVRSGEVDIVFAPKGSGKSALYSMLIAEVDSLFDDRVLIAPAENPTGTPAFANVGDGNPSEEDLARVWKLYFLMLISQELTSYGVVSAQTKELFKYLKEADLLPGQLSRPTILTMVKEYVMRFTHPKSQSTTVLLDSSGAVNGFQGTIEFGEPSVQRSRDGHVSIDYLFGLVQSTLKATDNYSLWLLLDRLDVAFASDPQLERKALRALFRAYSDVVPFDRIRIKIFLRTDIWDSISDDQFREASHLVREAKIDWKSEGLRQLIVRRLAQSPALLAHYGKSHDEVMRSAESQTEFFYLVFPRQVNSGSGKSSTLDWVLRRTADGTGHTAPRELIHLLTETRLAQLKRDEVREALPTPPALFAPKTLDDALGPVSEARIVKTLYAEYPDVRDNVSSLAGQKAEHNAASLARAWGTSEDDARVRAERLVNVGFFERRSKTNYRVPFMYRPYLKLVQGAAPEVRDSKEDD